MTDTSNVTPLRRSRRRPAKVDSKPTPQRVSDTALANLRAAARRILKGDAPPAWFSAPLHPPAAMPKNAPSIAQDDSIANVWAWAQQSAQFSAFAEGTTFMGYAALSILAQRAEYRVISETIASEMTREWIEFKSKGEDDKTDRITELEDEMHRLDVQGAFREGGALYDGFYGRGHLYLDTGDTDDHDELRTPIGDGRNLMSRAKIGVAGQNGLEKSKKILAIRPIEPVWCYPTQYDSNNPLKGDWYRPTTWHVMGTEVHVSRLLPFIGRPVSDMLKPAYSFGGLSMSQMAKPYVDNWLRTRQAVSDKVANYSVRGLKTPGVGASLMAGAEELTRRAEVFTLLAQNNGLMLVGQDEEYFEVDSPLSTLEQLQAQSQEHMASVSRIPLVKLLGIQPAGLNASSEGEIRAFYDWIKAFQEFLFRKHLTTIVGFIMLGLWGEVDDDITFDFVDLWRLDEAAKVSVEKTKTDIDDANVAMGAVSPEEVRQRLAKDKDSPYAGLDLDPSELPEPPGGEMDPGAMMGHNGGPGLEESKFPGEPGSPHGAEPGAKNLRDRSENTTARAGNLPSPTGGFGGGAG